MRKGGREGGRNLDFPLQPYLTRINKVIISMLARFIETVYFGYKEHADTLEE